MVKTRLIRRVVCDTNTVVSALLFAQGSLAWLRTAWRTGHIVPLVCHTTVTELLRVLTYPKFRLDQDEQRELLGDFLPYAEALELSDPPTVPDCRDANDRIVLQLGLVAQADAIVTGDKDLLALRTQFPVPIVTPAELRELTAQ